MTTTSRTRKCAALLGSIAAVAALSSCGTEHGTATPGEIDVRTLDIGTFPVDPLDIHLDSPPGLVHASQVGGLRLSEYVVNASDIDPHLTFGLRSTTFTSGTLPGPFGNDAAMTAVAKRDNMYFGFESVGSDTDGFLSSGDWPSQSEKNATSIDLMVMQFPDADTAGRAATDFSNADIGITRNQPLAIGKYPAAHANWRPGTAVARSFLAHGSYVAAVAAFAPTADPQNLTTLVEKTYDTAFPVLDQLQPISDEDTARLDWDPEYMISRALNPDQFATIGFEDENAAFGTRGILHYMPFRAEAKKVFTAMNAEKFARTDAALVVRTKDTASALKAVHDKLTPDPHGSTATAAVPKIADSACVQNDTDADVYMNRKRFTCLVAYRNYVGYVDSDQVLDAHQRAAAQYALLANSQWEP
ncbi:DUF7373 family lipoprotein [Nocardia macrotermitis]|uniref:Uncharacterized protein n=1 Tax=Nocardia macrotermitis TaxID=2585198 RepID=A0A7K0D017_9NOCA|nr:hypothetical protein [Nocardia macrotermitis]MQY19063.1 hypothetical protein [Nocardia macrotermitis]